MDLSSDSFKVDYAASDRSSCNRCRQNIAKDALRVGPMVQSNKGDFKYPAWHHLACFEDGYLKKYPTCLSNIAQISGIDRLKFDDQKKLKSLVVGGDSTLETKPVTEAEKELAKESKLVWARREKLDDLTTAELQDLLDHNGQPNSGKIFGGRNKLLDRAADGMAFGALPKCPLCKKGDLLYSSGRYKCTGEADEFARCEWKSDDIERSEWKVPKYLRDSYDFLGSFKFKAREKKTVVL